MRGRKKTLKAMVITLGALGMFFFLTTVALAATLKPQSAVKDDFVRLGDLFDGVENKDYILGSAPAPGQDMMINARALERIATALNVSWRPVTGMEQVVLRRDAITVGEGDITRAIETAIKEKGITDTFSITLMNTVTPIILPSDMTAGVEVQTLSFDPARDSFTARLAAPSTDNPIKNITVSGRIERMIAVPVLKNPLHAGDIISSMDLDWVDVPRTTLSPDVLVTVDDVINKTPRRTLGAGKPLSINDLQSPKMVDRGDMITLIFANGPMVLTTKGKSLQAGAMGDVVRVSNIDSNKSLQGIVTAHKEVTIR